MTKMVNNHINEIKDIILNSIQRIVPQVTDVEISMEKTYNGRDYIEVTSTFFQTIPSIFKYLRITGVAEPYVEENGNIRLIFHFSYNWGNYTGGTNGTELGLMIFEIIDGHLYLKQPFTYSN